MASQDVLSLSLDDIIRMKGRGRGGKGPRGGRSRGRGAASGRDPGFTRGGNSGGVRGRGRGVGVLSTKLTGRGALQGQNRGGRGGSATRGSGRGSLIAGGGRGRGRRGRGINTRGVRGTGTRGGRGISTRGGRGISTRGGRGISTRGGRGISARGGRGISTRGGRGISTRGVRGISTRGARGISTRGGRGRGRTASNQAGSSSQLDRQEMYQQVMGTDTTFRQKLVRRKIQQARKTLAMSRQNNRAQARANIVDARRGITGGMKQSKGNLGTPLRVRVGSGTIVRGLRSDQLLLLKMQNAHNTNTNTRLNSTDTFTEKNPSGQESVRGAGSVVSLSTQRGLTVSIKNNIASYNSQHNGAAPRNRPRLNRNRLNHTVASNYGATTFTVVNDRVYPPPEPPFQMSKDPPRKPSKRNIISSRDPRARMAMSVVNVTPENLRSMPEPHRQILDPKVQKEIAMLQGKEEVSLNNGPGPGVKGFRHIPSQTTRSLNERFTEERMVTA